MSLLVAGDVKPPRFETVPQSVATDCDDALFLSSAYGLTADPWQELVIRAWLGRKQGGRWSAPRCGLSVPRQNGKNAVIEIRELFGMVALGERFLHTAHEVKTARKAFLRLCSFFENERQYPELAELVRDIRKTNGQEAIVLNSGASVEFIARSKSSGRGFSVDVLVLDEAQESSEEALAALLPTISASANPQLIMTGTPPGPNVDGEVFTRMRSAGIEGSDSRLCWQEWSSTGDLDSVETWAAANPNLQVRLHVDTVADERAAMDDDTFKRERAGVWTDYQERHAPVISPELWSRQGRNEAPDGKVSYGVKFSPDGATVALAVAVRHEFGVHVEGIQHVELVHGTQWLVDWLAERWRDCSVIVVDGKSGSGALVKALQRAGVQQRRVLVPTTDQVVAAHAALLEAVTEGTVSHNDDDALNAAVRSAGRRLIGQQGGWGFQPLDGGDVTLLEAVTHAHFGALTAKVPTRSGGRRAVVL